jgi:hypothetical protein
MPEKERVEKKNMVENISHWLWEHKEFPEVRDVFNSEEELLKHLNKNKGGNLNVSAMAAYLIHASGGPIQSFHIEKIKEYLRSISQKE